MNEAISEALRWLAAARELLEAEPFTEEFRRLLTMQAVERAVTALNQCPHGLDE
jgi:hypothetical protein